MGIKWQFLCSFTSLVSGKTFPSSAYGALINDITQVGKERVFEGDTKSTPC